MRLKGLAWPAPGPQYLAFGLGKTDGGATGPVLVSLMQGDAVIATRSEQPNQGGTTGYSFQLSDAEVAQISDYANLRLRVSVGNPYSLDCPALPGGAPLQVSFAPAGIGNGSCNDCGNLNALTTLALSSGCLWTGPATVCGMGAPIGWTFTYQGTNGWVLTFEPDGMTWSAASWDGRSALTLTASGTPMGKCTHYPNQIILAPL